MSRSDPPQLSVQAIRGCNASIPKTGILYGALLVAEINDCVWPKLADQGLEHGLGISTVRRNEAMDLPLCG